MGIILITVLYNELKAIQLVHEGVLQGGRATQPAVKSWAKPMALLASNATGSLRVAYSTITRVASGIARSSAA